MHDDETPMSDEMAPEEWEGYLRIREILNPKEDDLKLRGKTYPVRMVNTPIAARIIDLCRSDKILFAMLMQSVQDNFETPDMADELAERGDELILGAVEAGMAQAIVELRKGFANLSKLERRLKGIVKAQAKAHEELKETADWAGMSRHFAVGSIGDAVKEIGKPEEDEGYHGGTYL
jgi:hypothetical protein